MKTDTLKYFLYARKSSESSDRQINSIEDQINVLRQFAHGKKLTIVEEFSEAKSAKETGREKFNEMLLKIEKGYAKGIITWKLDRLTRNAVDAGKIITLVQNGLIQELVTPERIHRNNDNIVSLYLEFGISNYDLIKLKENTQRGMIEKAVRGWYPSKAPLGYKSNPHKVKGEKEIIIDDDRFYLVRQLFDMMLTGTYSVAEIHRIATNEFKLTSSRKGKLALSNIYNIFYNPFYYGVFEYPNGSKNLYNGLHFPMITQEEFDRIQFLLGRKSINKPRTKSFAYTGMMKCSECGAGITAEEKFKYQKNGIVRRYIYYRCTRKINPKCSQKSIEVKVLESQIKDFIKKISIPKEFVQWAIEILKEENEKENRNSKKLLSKYEDDYKKVLRKLDELINMKLDSLISNEQFTVKKAEIEKEKVSIKNLLDNYDRKVNDWINNIERLFDFASNAREKFENGSLVEKKQILFALSSNLFIKDRNLLISIEKPIIFLEKIVDALERVHQHKSRLEPQIKPLKQKSYSNKLTDYSKMYPRQELNLRPAV